MQFRYAALFASFSFTMALAHAGLAETQELVKKSPALKTYKIGGTQLSSAVLRETAVPQMYKALDPASDKTLFYVHDGLDYVIQSSGWQEVKGQQLAAVNGDPAQLQLDKQLILSKLPLDLDMSYKIGDPTRRVVVVLDALDCAHCRDFDAVLKKYNQEYNATVHILPTALVKSPENVNLVRNVWCGPNPGAAWRELMTNPNYKVAKVDTANCDPRKSVETSTDIAGMLRIHGTPGFILGSVNGKSSISGFPANSKPVVQKQMLDVIMGKK